jgi:signal transduction histidine kinase
VKGGVMGLREQSSAPLRGDSSGIESTRSANLQNEIPLEISIPAASLESILCTEELLNRPSRPPDHKVENFALVALTSALADSPQTILQTLADKVLEVLQADSAGLSLLTKDEKRFYWAAIAGAWQPHIGGGTPRDFGPCGDVLDHNRSMLFTHWERRYPYLSTAIPLADEGLLVPFYVNGKSVGTIWAIAHTNRRKFDAEDLRLLESMGHFASVAYQAVGSIEILKSEIVAREKAEGELRQLTADLEEQVRLRTEELEQRNAQLADAKSELTQLNRIATAGELSAAIAHEINQPLTGIVTMANAAIRWLSSESPNIGRARDAMNKVVAAGHHANDVITNVRGLFGKDTQEKTSTDVNKLIRTVLGLVYIDLRKHSIESQVNLSKQLPPVNGNEVQLEQVILNLVMNAIESMNLAVEPRVRSIKSETTEHNSVRVSIADIGSGIDPANLNRIFQPMFTTKARGMGMGLSICKSIIESHNGRIWVTAGTPRGSIFQFELPISGTEH